MSRRRHDRPRRRIGAIAKEEEEEEEPADLECAFCGRMYRNDNWRTTPEEGFCSADCMGSSMVHMDRNPEQAVREWFRAQGFTREFVLLPSPDKMTHLNPIDGEVDWEEALAYRLGNMSVEEKAEAEAEQLSETERRMRKSLSPSPHEK